MYKVLIIGLGNIGMDYDLYHNPSKYILSHARAFDVHEQYEIVAGVDSNRQQCELFSSHYGYEAFTNLDEALINIKPDIIVIATPTELHYSIINKLLKQVDPKAILCEKPISYNIDEAQKIVAKCKSQDCALFVNYMRRSDIGVAEIVKRFQDNRIKGPIKGIVYYSKGMYNSASHFVNLLQLLFGKVKEVQLHSSGRLWDGLDPEPDFEIIFESAKIQFLALNAENFFHNSMELIASNGRLRYEQGGQYILWDRINGSNTFSNYITLAEHSDSLVSDFLRIQYHVVEQMAKNLVGQSSNICSGDEALSTLKVMAKIKELL